MKSAEEGSWVGGEEGGERAFFLAAAPDRSFSRPPAFLSFCRWTTEREERNDTAAQHHFHSTWGLKEALSCRNDQTHIDRAPPPTRVWTNSL